MKDGMAELSIEGVVKYVKVQMNDKDGKFKFTRVQMPVVTRNGISTVEMRDYDPVQKYEVDQSYKLLLESRKGVFEGKSYQFFAIAGQVVVAKDKKAML